MSDSIPNITHHRFAIAKEMYLQGASYVNKESRVGLISAILNFDYAVETVLKAVALENDLGFYPKSRRFKDFPELVDEICNLKPLSKAIINQINALHSLRNNVQHHAVIPSSDEVNKHQHTTRLFIDEICTAFYNNTITFDSISLSFLVDNLVERIILDEMEKAIAEERYTDGINYARKAVEFHITLLKQQVELPYQLLRGLDNYREITNALRDPPRPGRYTINPGDNYFRGIKKTIEWIIDKIALSELELDVRQLLPLYYRIKPTEGMDDFQTVEQARMLAFNIITKSQSQVIKTNDVNIPFIFECAIINRDGKKVLKLGVASAKEISGSKFIFIHVNGQRNEVQVKTKNGVQYIDVEEVNSNMNYELIASVIDVAGKEGYGRIRC